MDRCMSLEAAPALLTPSDIRRLAEAGGIRPSKQKGQNFLLDPNTVRMIIDRSGVSAGECVVEVGPGLGSLTLGLLEAGAFVGAIELDEQLAALLPATIRDRGGAFDAFALINADALQVEQLPVPDAARAAGLEPTSLIANLPYNVATPILLTMLARFDSLTYALVMVQKEVAERIAAGPGSKAYGAPSVKAAWYGSSELAGTISRQVFWPVPNVDSALVRVRRDRAAQPGEPSREAVFAVVDAAFAQRRKTLRAALTPLFGSRERVDAILTTAGIEAQRRGETLAIDEFVSIAAAAALCDA